MDPLLLDFNRVDAKGRLPARVASDALGFLIPGTKIIVTDGEGTYAEAEIDELRTSLAEQDEYVVLVSLVGEVWHDQSAQRVSN